jgi:hypothetical protein
MASCAQCGDPIVRRRVRPHHDLSLCLRCEQRARSSAYFQRYYESNKGRILEKNRQWAKDNASTLAERRRERASQRVADDKHCVDCGAVVSRAERCRRCHIRYRYANDPAYREHRLSITRRWLDKRAGGTPV